jgi:hypothetical protein
MFFSISPNDYADALLDEIYGCFKYIGIPYDTVMNMPIQNRKYFIARHNHDTEELNKNTAMISLLVLQEKELQNIVKFLYLITNI